MQEATEKTPDNDTWPPRSAGQKRIVRLIPAAPGWTVSIAGRGRVRGAVWEIPCWALTESGEMFPMVPNDNLDGYVVATADQIHEWTVNPPGHSYAYAVTRAVFGEPLERPKYAVDTAEAIAISEDDEAVHVLWRWVG